MPTISSLAQALVARNPFLEDALSRNLINYQSLAEELTPLVSRQLNKQIKTSTVMISLRRYAKKLVKPKTPFHFKGILDLKTNLVSITFQSNDEIINTTTRDMFESKQSFFLTTSNSVSTITFSNVNKTFFLEKLKNKNILELHEQLGALCFRELQSLSFFSIMQLFSKNMIEPKQIIENKDELIIILDEH